MRETQIRFDADISLIRDTVFFRIEKKRIQFRTDDILLVGEFSAPEGSHVNDYFFVFKVRGSEELIEVPASTDGIFELLSDLKQHLPTLRNPRLQMSAEFDSNVMFPPQYAGMQVFQFRSETKPWVDLPMLRNLVWVETTVREVNPELELG